MVVYFLMPILWVSSGPYSKMLDKAEKAARDKRSSLSVNGYSAAKKKRLITSTPDRIGSFQVDLLAGNCPLGLLGRYPNLTNASLKTSYELFIASFYCYTVALW